MEDFVEIHICRLCEVCTAIAHTAGYLSLAPPEAVVAVTPRPLAAPICPSTPPPPLVLFCCVPPRASRKKRSASACLLACLPACLLTCLPACLLACLPACLLACMPACLLACFPACLHACLPARLFACLPVCRKAGEGGQAKGAMTLAAVRFGSVRFEWIRAMIPSPPPLPPTPTLLPASVAPSAAIASGGSCSAFLFYRGETAPLFSVRWRGGVFLSFSVSGKQKKTTKLVVHPRVLDDSVPWRGRCFAAVPE